MDTVRKWDQIDENRIVMTKMTYLIPHKDFHLHWHTVFEIVRVTAGTLSVSLNGEIRRLDEGDCLLISPGCVHDIGQNPDKAAAMIVQFPSPEEMERTARKDSSLNFFLYSGYTSGAGRLIPAGSKYTAQTGFLCDEIFRVSHDDGENGEDGQIADGIVQGAVRMLLAYFTSETRLRLRQWKTDERFDMVKLCAYIDGLELPSVSLSEAAAYMGYSRKYFSLKFSRITGIGFKQYIDRLKMQEVRRMLGEGMNATDIAGLLGYSCVQNLSRAFRRVHRMSISEMMHRKK